MAVEHMVWIRFKEGVNDQRKAHHLEQLRSLKDRVPGIEELKLGENLTDRAAGYTHGLIVRLVDRDALKAYGPHPEHQKVAQPLKEDADLMAMDIEV